MIDRTVLAPASYDAMETEVKLKDGKGTGYGLGLDVGERGGHRFFRAWRRGNRVLSRERGIPGRSRGPSWC
ncbi:MAG: hypothetical protein WDN04_19230 [Rhodospirillales bacterium]